MVQLPTGDEWRSMTVQEQEVLVKRLTGCATNDSQSSVSAPNIIKSLQHPATSIIVTARNYSRFLRDCLSSCLHQSVAPLEVIYSDDGSTDNSIAVARSIHGVKIISHPSHTGVCEARNRAARASRGEVLIHCDGDDILPSNFVERALINLTPETAFTYHRCQAFGNGMNDLWFTPDWGTKPLWEQNFVHTTAAYWRWAFEAAGGWRENPTKTFWDWDLALRASRFGKPVASDAVFLYRHHNKNWSRTEGEIKDGRDNAWKRFGEVRRHNARLSIGCIWSGRLPKLFPLWLKTLAVQIAAADIRPEQVELVILNNSKRPRDEGMLYRESAKHHKAFSSIRILPYPTTFAWKEELERRNKQTCWLAEAYTRLLQETSGEVVFFIEDDIVLPRGGFSRLWTELTEGLPMRGAVAALYEDRHGCPGWVSGWFDQTGNSGAGSVKYIERLPKDRSPLEVDVTGTGCLLFWRELAQPMVAGYLGTIPAQDWALCWDIRQHGRKVLLLTDVKCRHYQTTSKWV